MKVRDSIRDHINKVLMKSKGLTLAEICNSYESDNPYIKGEFHYLLAVMPNVIRMDGSRYKLSEYINDDGSYCEEALGVRHHVKDKF